MLFAKTSLALFAIVVVVQSSPVKRNSDNNNVGCHENCHPIDPEKINVHLMAHSHDDVGWLKTFEDYYWGWHNEIHRSSVKDIITTMVEALKANPLRRFIQVETAFFWMWWQNSTDEMRQDFVNLVNNGQLEMINGAWSMNDEAATHYQSIIDQFTHGLRVINETLGQCGTPRIGWQIDPFGHSREQANLFAQFGFDAVFFARIDFEDKMQRIEKRNMEVIWRGSPDNAWDTSNIFTNMFPDFYFPPAGFCFDIECGDRVTPNNAQLKLKALQKDAEKYAKYYRTKNVLIPMGGDFHFRSASTNFANLDKLIELFKDHETLNVIYSTPSCYVKAVNAEARRRDVSFSLKRDDFFPYGDAPHTYWTGYFSSRPTAKRWERTSNNFLQTAKQLSAYSTMLFSTWIEELTPLKQAMGIMQHHDAITGTAKQRVANDYIRLLTEGINHLEESVSKTIENLLQIFDKQGPPLNLRLCSLSNVTICPQTLSKKFVVALYNPLERPVTYPVRVPVPDAAYKVTGPDGYEIVDIVNPISDFAYIEKSSGVPTHPKELVFHAKNIPGFGIKLYYVEAIPLPVSMPEQIRQFKFGSRSNGFEIDPDTGLLKAVTLNNQTVEIAQEFFYYSAADGDNRLNNQASGAYIFRPNGSDAIKVAEQVKITTQTGNLVDEVRQQFNEWITQIIRVYKHADDGYIEFDWLIGPIEMQGTVGKEVITRFTVSNFNNGNTFYTDSNGRQMLRRVLNKRYDYDYTSSNEPVAANYYPINSKIVIKDEGRGLQVAVLNDRAQGGSSLRNGEIELMLHRRLMKDDDKGVVEPLNEQEFGQGLVVRGTTYLTFGSTSTSKSMKLATASERELGLKVHLQPTMLVGSVEEAFERVKDGYVFVFEGLKSQLPPNVHILTFEPIAHGEFLLRLEHIMENNEDFELSKPVSINLKDVFSKFRIIEMKETTLGANQWRDEFDDKPKYTWKVDQGGLVNNKAYRNPVLRAVKLDEPIVLHPMEIRTFIIYANL